MELPKERLKIILNGYECGNSKNNVTPANRNNVLLLTIVNSNTSNLSVNCFLYFKMEGYKNSPGKKILARALTHELAVEVSRL